MEISDFIIYWSGKKFDFSKVFEKIRQIIENKQNGFERFDLTNFFQVKD